MIKPRRPLPTPLISWVFLSANAAADLIEGLVALQAKDYEAALRDLRSSRDPGSRYFLGTMYEEGEGVPQDYKEAVKWYTKGAEHGDADAQTNLGVMYGRGRGVLQDNVYAHM